MKKTISLLLVLCLMLCSCGSETSDEPIEKATEYTPISETELAADISVDSQGEMLAEASTEAFTETLAIPSTEAPQENDDGYIRVNETVYTTTDVNVRTGPGTEYDKVGRILKGQSVNRIGIGDDGWSKVIYEGTTCLVNKFDIRDENKLSEIEAKITFAKTAMLDDAPIEGNFDFEHYKAIHKFIFEDLYDWAGIPRTVDISKKGTFFVAAKNIDEIATACFERLKNQNYFKNPS